MKKPRKQSLPRANELFPLSVERIKRGWSQNKLASISGIRGQRLSVLERMEKQPTDKEREALCTALCITRAHLSRLLCEKPTKHEIALKDELMHRAQTINTKDPGPVTLPNLDLGVFVAAYQDVKTQLDGLESWLNENIPHFRATAVNEPLTVRIRQVILDLYTERNGRRVLTALKELIEVELSQGNED